MKTKTSRSLRARQEAVSRFAEGFNCSEATLLGVAQALRIRSALIPRMATGLGGGIGRHGEVCGALTGAVLGLGLKYGRDRAKDAAGKERMYLLTDQLVRAFETKFKTCSCRQLTRVDLLTERGRKEAARRRIHQDLCPCFVAFAAGEAVRIGNRKG